MASSSQSPSRGPALLAKTLTVSKLVHIYSTYCPDFAVWADPIVSRLFFDKCINNLIAWVKVVLWVTGAIVQREKWREVVAEIQTLVQRSAWRVLLCNLSRQGNTAFRPPEE